jgi:FKBP-type peptidyl-prolyl cis-trans isomerase
MHMRKSLTVMTQLLAAGMMLGVALAQTPTTPAAQPTQPAAPKAAAAQTPKTGTTKKPAVGAKPATALTLKTQKEKASYAVGISIGSGLHRQGVPVDAALVARGLRDAMTGAKPLLTDDEMKAVLAQLQTQVRDQQQAKTREAAAPNHKEGDDFLAANKSKEGVVVLPSGLQYKILKEGSGPKPTASDTVSCNYKGSLLNGTEFDSSYKRNEPASFPVSGVIKGWTEALQLMPVGSKWQLFIPSDLAYGDGGRPGIPPGATLIFEVELLSIAEAKK